MKHRILRIVVSVILTSVFFATAASADSLQNYLLWQLPSSGVSFPVSFPVYVYQNGAQVAYIPSAGSQVFAGAYTKGTTTETYTLYQETKGRWQSCTVALSLGMIDLKTTTCPGAVIHIPNSATSNVSTLALGVGPWENTSTAPPNPEQPDYSSRTITFINNTAYPVIQIGESCNTSSAPPCQTSPIIATIFKNSPHILKVKRAGLISAGFYLSSYCTAQTASECGTPPNAGQCSSANSPPKNWVCTGGYFGGNPPPYATKIEVTIPNANDSSKGSASNIDVSAVDGFNSAVNLYPSSPTICTYTVPPEGSKILGAGLYSSGAPLASMWPLPHGFALADLCEGSSQLPPGYSSPIQEPWKLSVLSGTTFQGCQSPCTYISIRYPPQPQKPINPEVALYCCPDTTSKMCIQPKKDQLGPNTSTYNTTVTSQFRNVYGFAYGDAGSDYSCPPQTDFVVEFVGQLQCDGVCSSS